MKIFFDFTPHDDATYIILRHLPVEYQSQLQQIIKRHSNLTIVEATNGMLVEKNTIYIPPSSMYTTIKNDRLYLHPRTKESRGSNWTIDVFLESLAKEKGKFCVAVILSGAGSDGAKGVTFIKEAGGMVVAQNIASCEHSPMPRNAIATGNVDYELTPSEMPLVILRYISRVLKNNNVAQNLKKDSLM